VAAIADTIHAAKSACILRGILISRCGLGAQATAVVEVSGLPFATCSWTRAYSTKPTRNTSVCTTAG
jgi:hypothetical protein